ncbi:MAG: hypothetical protein FWH17_09180 [Oscillospiraceae bacterium]|nr:hypothetical protein [Oscillospiraceae bacterium]
MNVFKEELYRLARSKILWLLCFGMILCNMAFMLLYEEYRFSDEYGYALFSPKSYIALKSDIDHSREAIESLKERHPALRDAIFSGGMTPEYADSLFGEAALFQYVYSEGEAIAGYDSYLESVAKNARALTEIPLFSDKESFTNRNILKTADDYAKLKEVVPVWDENAGIKQILESPFTDVLFIIGLLYVSLKVVTDEKPQELLLRTMKKGRTARFAAKLWSLLLFCFFAHTLLYISQIFFAHTYYGLGDLSRPIQSVFITAPYGISVFQTLLLVYIAKLAIYVLFTMIFFASCVKTSTALASVSVIAFILAISAGLYAIISPFSVLNIFKYINLFFLLRPANIVVTYINLNIFGQPVNILSVAIAVVSIAYALLFAVSVVSSPAIRTYRTIAGRRRSLPAVLQGHTTKIISHELWKMLWAKKVVLILLGLVLFQVWRFDNAKIRVNPDEAAYHRAVLLAQGQDEPLRWALARLDALTQSNASEMEIAATARVIDRLSYLESIDGGVLVYETGYAELLGDGKYVNDVLNALILVVMLVLAVLPVREWEMERLIRVTVRGRGTLAVRKGILTSMVCILIFCIVYIPDLWRVARIFGLPHTDAPAASFPWLASGGGLDLNLGFVLCRMYAVRLVSAMLLALGVLVIPLKTQTVSYIFFAAVYVLPVLLRFLSVSFAEYYPIVWLLIYRA